MIEIIIAICVWFGDQRLKQYVEINGDEHLHHNYGAAINMGADKPRVIKILSIIITMIVAICFIASLTVTGKKILRFGLSLLLGGAFSNTYDRIMRGYVVDYIKLPFKRGLLGRLTWNIADFAIILGTVFVTLDV